MRSHHALARFKHSFLTRAIAFFAILALLAPSIAQAATPYTIVWRDDEAYDSQLSGWIADDYFSVNGTPLYTAAQPPGTPNPNDGITTYISSTTFDSTLLGAGANDFTCVFSTANGDNSYVDAHDIVNLTSPNLAGPIPLFSIDHIGKAVTGATKINLSLAQINPPLAKDLAALMALLDANEAALDANASKVPDLAHQQQELQNLQSDLTALTNETLDQISQEDLDAVLAKYSDLVDAKLKAALEQFVKDLKQSVADLQAQLTTLVNQFSQLADDVTNLATQGVTGWDPADPNNYGLTSDGSTVPNIPAPDLSQTAGAFDPNTDPYKLYADAISARLQALVQGSDIPASARPQFVSVVRGWRANQRALQSALAARTGVSQAETNAFLNAQNRVLGQIRQYMDGGDWFLTNPVDPSIRSLIDGILAQKFKDLAADIKDAMNVWTEPHPTQDEDDVQQTIGAIGRGMDDPDFDDFSKYDTRPQMKLALYEARSVARGALNLIPGPFGVFISLCEAVTGKDGCTSTSKGTLGTWDRVISGLSGVIGSFQFWHEVKGALNPEVFDDLAQVSGQLSNLSLEERGLLGTKLGQPTLATVGNLGTEAFNEFAQAGLGRSNNLLIAPTVAVTDGLNAPFLALPGGKPPFIPKTSAILGQSKGGSYVRFYAKGPGTYSTGSFITLKSEAAGLTPAQIKDRFALPSLPTNVVDVAFPANEPIAIGVAAGAAHGNSWGTGGGLQIFWNRLNIPWAQYAKYFTNDRPIGLIYKP